MDVIDERYLVKVVFTVSGNKYVLIWWKNQETISELGAISFAFPTFAQNISQNVPQPYRQGVNSLRPRQNGRHFADEVFKCILLNENVWIPIKISLKFVPQGLINNIPALVQIMAWCRQGDKPLSGPMMVRLPTHICVTRPQWVNPWELHVQK